MKTRHHLAILSDTSDKGAVGRIRNTQVTEPNENKVDIIKHRVDLQYRTPTGARGRFLGALAK
jgi:hypothetical protein